MGAENRVLDEFHHKEVNASRLGDSEFCSLLENQEYDRLARLLKSEAASSGSSPVTTGLIMAARQLCQVCIDCQEQKAHLRQLQETAVAREKDMRQNLQSILNLLDKACSGQWGELSEPKLGLEQDLPGKPMAQPGFWQRTKELFGLELVPSEAQSDTTVPEETILSARPKQLPRQPGPESEWEEEIAPSMAVYCFGLFRVYVDGEPLDNWTGNISKSLFKYMTLNREWPIPIEVLMDTFWPEAEPESARRNLYQAIYQIRQAFQPSSLDIPIILSSNGSYRINPNIPIWLDCEEFTRQYEHGSQLYQGGLVTEGTTAYETADSLHDGDFLAEELYEDWTFQLRELFHQAHLKILEKLTCLYYQQERWAICIAYAQRLLSIDNCNEHIHRQLMKAYCQQGQRHLALRQYHRCAASLRQELDIEPLPETTELYQSMQKVGFIFHQQKI